MSSALAGTDTGDNGQPAHAGLFHSLNRSSGTLREHRHVAQEGGTKRPYADAPGDGIGARHGTLGHTGVEHRALDQSVRLAAASDPMLLATATA
jgi:hypothetical protein